MGRSPCCDKTGLKKGPWTQEEDLKLTQYIRIHGPGNWRTLPENAGLQRCGKSCRLRWTNYLRPDIKRGRFSSDEEETIIQLHSVLGNKWSAIATHLPGRTDNEIKNYWNTHIRKQLIRNGIDPVTHTHRLDLSNILNSAQVNLSNFLGLQTLMNPEVLMLVALLASASSSYQQNQESFLNNSLTTMNQNPNMHPQTCASRPSSLLSTELLDDQQNLMLVTHGQQFTGHIADPNHRRCQEILTLPSSTDNSISVQTYDNPQYVAPIENLCFQPPNTVSKTPTGQNIDIDSILQIPMSNFTHVSSSSSLVTSSVSEDETGSHCSNMFTFETPERFEFDDLM